MNCPLIQKREYIKNLIRREGWRLISNTSTAFLPFFPMPQHIQLRITISLSKCISGIWLHLQNICCTCLAQLWSDFKILIYRDQVVVPNCSQAIFFGFNLEMPQGFILLLYYFWSITVFASGWLSFVDMTYLFYMGLLMPCNFI